MEPFLWLCSNCITIRVSKTAIIIFVQPFKTSFCCSPDLFICRNVNTSKLSPGLAFRFPLSLMLKQERYCHIHISHSRDLDLYYCQTLCASRNTLKSLIHHFLLVQGVKSDVRTSSGMFLTHVERSYPMIQVDLTDSLMFSKDVSFQFDNHIPFILLSGN